MQMQTPPPPFKSGQIGFLVYKDVQCSEKHKKNQIFAIILVMVDFVLKFIRKLTKINDRKWQKKCPKRCSML